MKPPRIHLSISILALALVAISGSSTASARIGASDRSATAAFSFTNVAQAVGLRFRQGAFRFKRSNDPVAMMGGGLCWIDIDNDGWMDLFVVNSFSDTDIASWQTHGGQIGRAHV